MDIEFDYDVWADHIATCAPDLMPDVGNKAGEAILMCIPYGQSADEAAAELLDSADEYELPEAIEEEQLLDAITACCEAVDFDPTSGAFDIPDFDMDLDIDDEAPSAVYVYVRLTWELRNRSE